MGSDRGSLAVVVVGGGAGGVLSATQLLLRRHRPVTVTIVEPAPVLGAGPAYGTSHPRHLLNAPVREMSALPDQHDDLARWARAHDVGVGPDGFLPRRAYRGYLMDVLRRACRSAHPASRVRWVRDEAVTMSPPETHGSMVLGLAGGGHLEADRVVLAVGAPPPGWPEPLASRAAEGWPELVDDPWSPGLERVPAHGDVLLLGTGLTAVDALLTLSCQERDGVVHARSRHGLLPRAHAAEGAVGRWELRGRPRSPAAREVVRWVRGNVAEAEREGVDWRAVVSSLRRAAPDLWCALPPATRQRLWCHAGRQWEVHRHRMAPEVAAWLHPLVATDRCTVGPGRVVSVARLATGLQVELKAAGEREALRVSSVVNCTGPSDRVDRHSALLCSLLDAGWVRSHPTGVGIQVTADGHPRGPDPAAASRVHVIGWLRRGELLESTAIPEIRQQAVEMADAVVPEGDRGRRDGARMAVVDRPARQRSEPCSAPRCPAGPAGPCSR